MTNNLSIWVFNLTIRLAAIFCLGALVLSLVVGVSPLTAVARAGVAFVAFSTLGWAISLVFDLSAAQEPAESKPTGIGAQPVHLAGDNTTILEQQ